jgi:hypothetical protein
VIVFIDDAGRTAAMNFASKSMTLGARTCVPLFPAIVKQPSGAHDPVGAATVIVLFGWITTVEQITFVGQGG